MKNKGFDNIYINDSSIKNFGLIDLNPQEKPKKTDNMLISLLFFILFTRKYVITWLIYCPISDQNENPRNGSYHIVLIPKLKYQWVH